jgi:prepilin peptidase CpaA
MYPWLVDGVLVLALVPAFIWDVRVRRIPHWITLPTIAIGLLLAGLFWGVGDGWARPGLRNSFAAGAGAYVCFALAVLPGWMGGGDANLMAAIGTLLGFPAILLATVCITLVGALQGVVAMLARTSPGRALCRKLGMSGTDDPDFGRTVPYGIAIVIGTALFRIWQHIAAGR